MRIAIAAAAVVALAVSGEARAQVRSAAAPSGYSLLGGTTVPTGADVISGEFGWPSATFGFTHGMGPTTDVGIKFDLLYGFEYTTTSQFGIGVRIPLRLNLLRRDKVSVLVHVDPGIKMYTTTPVLFGLQWPVGVTLGYAATPEFTVGFGVEVPMFLWLTPSPAQFLLGPLFGPGFEYHVDRQLSIGLNTRFGPIFDTAGGGGQFGFITQMVLGYRL